MVTLLALSCQGKKVPKVIKSLNKALGLPTKSKVVWDILEIEGIDNEVEGLDNEVENNAAKIEMYHPNTTSTSTTKGGFMSEDTGGFLKFIYSEKTTKFCKILWSSQNI